MATKDMPVKFCDREGCAGNEMNVRILVCDICGDDVCDGCCNRFEFCISVYMSSVSLTKPKPQTVLILWCCQTCLPKVEEWAKKKGKEKEATSHERETVAGRDERGDCPYRRRREIRRRRNAENASDVVSVDS